VRESSNRKQNLFKPSSSDQFERQVLGHLDAAFNLARWLVGSDADDAVQESCLRAHRAFAQFRGQDARAWLLSIVRNTCMTMLQKRKTERSRATQLDESDPPIDLTDGPAQRVLAAVDAQELRLAIDSLEIEFREVIVLREMDGLSYKQVAEIAGIPIGTVMSRLSRGRQRLFQMLSEQTAGPRRKLP
jgi:RNA polymerase sigma-70 factor, ECF subfamily